jgi:predicted Zn-dependent protease
MGSVDHDDASIRDALTRAARELSGRSGPGKIFLEARVDVRREVGSDGRDDTRVIETAGAAHDSDDSFHVTDPGADGLASLARGALTTNTEAGGLWGASDTRAWVESQRHRLDSSWGNSVNASWTIALLAFRQRVWVVGGDGFCRQDARSGIRVETKTWFDGHPNSLSIVDTVLTAESADEALDSLPRSAARSAERRSSCRRATPGATIAVLGPGVGGIVAHELVGHAAEADIDPEKEAWLWSAPRPIYGALTVIDDPRRGRASWMIDDEGVAASETTLVDHGQPVDLLLDRASAALRSRPSNGHGRRTSYLTAVRPRMGCTWIAPGAESQADILRDTSSGVFIHRMNAGRTDPITGRATFVVTDADEIVNGELAFPLQSFLLELNGRISWASIDRIANDLTFDRCVGSCVREGQPLAVSVGAPTMRIGVASIVC